jgi:hypothetical protein
MSPKQRLPGPYQLSACEDHVPEITPRSPNQATLQF